MTPIFFTGKCSTMSIWSASSAKRLRRSKPSTRKICDWLMRWTTYPTIPAATDALRPRRRSRWHCDGKSVLLTREFEPAWFDVAPVEGRFQDFAVRGQGLGAHVRGRIWSPDDSCDPMPLLVAHDGPEYDEFAQLTRYSGAMIAAGTLPPHRVALLAPGARDEWYSASPLYAGALVRGVLRAVGAEVAVRGAPVAIGASLGALAMLHAQHRHAGAFAGLFLQSGSFFVPELDAQERGFSRWARVTGFVAEVLGGGRGSGSAPAV